MRIAVAVARLSALGGKERDALAIAGGLAARGNSVTILTRAASLQVPPGVVVRLVTDVIGWTNHARTRRFARAVGEARRAGSFDAIVSFEKLEEADAYYAADVCFGGQAGYLKRWLPRYATYAWLEAHCFGAAGPDILFLCRKQESEYRQHYRLAPGRATVLPPMIYPTSEECFYKRRAEIRADFGIPDTAMLAVSVAVYPKLRALIAVFWRSAKFRNFTCW